MNHQVSLAPMSSDFSAELRLEYCLFSSCVMSQLERTEAFGPEQWNNASSITGCWPLGDGFPSSCSVELISAMCFSVYVYRRPKGLFVFPPRCTLTRFPSNVSQTLLSLARRLFSQRVIESCQLAVPRVSNASCRKISHCFRMTSGIY